MGQGMAKNLMEKGHEVVAFDTSAEALKVAVGNGATEAKSPKVKINRNIKVLTY